jgi:hypothetical protein
VQLRKEEWSNMAELKTAMTTVEIIIAVLAMM